MGSGANSNVLKRRLAVRNVLRGDDDADLSAPGASRLLGERGARPGGDAVLYGTGELDDPEAAAFSDRTGYEHIPFGNAATGSAALLNAVPRAARDAIVEPFWAAERLLRGGYRLGREDAQAVSDALVASGMAATGSLAGTAPRGSFGTFIGRRGSANLEKLGRPAAARALDLAEQLEAQGAKQSEIRSAAHRILETDPDLGGLHRGADAMWRVEVRDDLASFNEGGPRRSTLGRDLDHPTLYEAYPDLADVHLRRSSDIEGAEFWPNKLPQEIGLGSANDKPSILHETQHGIADREGFALGSNPDEELAMLQRDARRAPRLPERTRQDLEQAKSDLEWHRKNTPNFGGSKAEERLTDFIDMLDNDAWSEAAYQRYARSAGEVEAYNVENRLLMTPEDRRRISPLRTQAVPNHRQIVRQND
jgi:hypothetical protein